MYLRQLTPPATPLVSLVEAKRHLRIFHDEEDAYISALLAAAEAYVDGDSGILGRAVISQEWELTLDRFPYIGNYIPMHSEGHYRRPVYGPGEIRIPLPPLISVESIEYDALDQTPTALTGFRVFGVGDKRGGFVLPEINTIWPWTQREPRTVRISFTAGYGDAATDVPPGIKQAMLLLLSHWYEHRESVVGVAERSITPTELPDGVDALLYPHRFWA